MRTRHLRGARPLQSESYRIGPPTASVGVPGRDGPAPAGSISGTRLVAMAENLVTNGEVAPLLLDECDCFTEHSPWLTAVAGAPVLGEAGIDVGASEEGPVEPALEDEPQGEAPDAAVVAARDAAANSARVALLPGPRWTAVLGVRPLPGTNHR